MLKLLAGERRPERLALDSPQPEMGRPPEPPDLGAIGKAKWLELCSLLEAEGRLSVSDSEPLEQYARTYDLWRRCESLIRQGGPQGGAFTGNGRQIKAPARLYKDLAGLLVRLEAELGLTPSARCRVKTLAAGRGPQGKLAKYAQ